MKILISSQDFWFWPTTQMFAFIKHLFLNWFNWTIFLKRNKSTEIFLENFLAENQFIKNIFLIDTSDWLFDAYIWFYDPEIIFEANKKNKISYFICNLTYLWEDDFVTKYQNISSINDFDINKISNHHEMIILWYLLADKVFIRITDNIDKEWKLYKAIKDKTNFLWPIIYPKLYKGKPWNYALVQLWWQVNPLSNNLFYETYFYLVKKIISNIDKEKVIVVNPLLFDIAKSIFRWYKLVKTTSQENYQRILSQSSLIMSPFWINSFFESALYDVPTFILPEQHIWHTKSIISYFDNFDNIRKCSFTFFNYCPYKFSWDNEKDFIDYLPNSYLSFIEKNIDLNIDVWFNIMNEFWYSDVINKDIDLLIKEFI